MKAEEFFQLKNGGKSSRLAREDGEFISPIWAVELMQQYADESRKKTAVDFAKHLSAIIDSGDDLYSFNEEYDNWFKEQEE